MLHSVGQDPPNQDWSSPNKVDIPISAVSADDPQLAAQVVPQHYDAPEGDQPTPPLFTSPPPTRPSNPRSAARNHELTKKDTPNPVPPRTKRKGDSVHDRRSFATTNSGAYALRPAASGTPTAPTYASGDDCHHAYPAVKRTHTEERAHLPRSDVPTHASSTATVYEPIDTPEYLGEGEGGGEGQTTHSLESAAGFGQQPTHRSMSRLHGSEIETDSEPGYDGDHRHSHGTETGPVADHVVQPGLDTTWRHSSALVETILQSRSDQPMSSGLQTQRPGASLMLATPRSGPTISARANLTGHMDAVYSQKADLNVTTGTNAQSAPVSAPVSMSMTAHSSDVAQPMDRSHRAEVAAAPAPDNAWTGIPQLSMNTTLGDLLAGGQARVQVLEATLARCTHLHAASLTAAHDRATAWARAAQLAERRARRARAVRDVWRARARQAVSARDEVRTTLGTLARRVGLHAGAMARVGKEIARRINDLNDVARSMESLGRVVTIDDEVDEAQAEAEAEAHAAAMAEAEALAQADDAPKPYPHMTESEAPYSDQGDNESDDDTRTSESNAELRGQMPWHSQEDDEETGDLRMGPAPDSYPFPSAPWQEASDAPSPSSSRSPSDPSPRPDPLHPVGKEPSTAYKLSQAAPPRHRPYHANPATGRPPGPRGHAMGQGQGPASKPPDDTANGPARKRAGRFHASAAPVPAMGDTPATPT
ncbi:hypothetical protein CXG81DRAFT_20072 [Caulochytrium protostelioides]|uniref:Uncharacterized protein n=1 Tax=Caulochytrium protostelioides TaxID=1555241 RepID=A0A4V1IUA6_9FUNG|nr:hypothetical protein CXG81DRAFT_20072 [Caulochytrium protostelioides]|eukprot:RKO99888.1 hypothetical protein CXG81DRAFT_20072 [Caulochytrium protostelioides]